MQDKLLKRIAELSPEKRKLLEQLLSEKRVLVAKSLMNYKKQTLSLTEEAILDSTINPEGAKGYDYSEPANILLTGATGFLGTYLLYELLQHTKADIYCLVRGSDVEEAKNRIQLNLESNSLSNGGSTERIIPVIGDLSNKSLSLSTEQFRMLANKIDTVYHCGAMVKWGYPYHALKAANVSGTQEILRLASHSKVKPVHFISTLAVFLSTENLNGKIITEDDSTDYTGNLIVGGYAESKWVAEKLVTIAESRGIPISIYRPGLISGHSQTGKSNSNDFLYLCSKICIILGSRPESDSPLGFTPVPVDYASKAIIHLSRRRDSLGKTFHIVNPNPLKLSNIGVWLNNHGVPLKAVPYSKWREDLLELASKLPENEMTFILPMLTSLPSDDKIKGPEFQFQNTIDGLEGTSVLCPPIDEELLNVYFSDFISRGLLDGPLSVRNSD